MRLRWRLLRHQPLLQRPSGPATPTAAAHRSQVCVQVRVQLAARSGSRPWLAEGAAVPGPRRFAGDSGPAQRVRRSIALVLRGVGTPAHAPCFRGRLAGERLNPQLAATHPHPPDTEEPQIEADWPALLDCAECFRTANEAKDIAEVGDGVTYNCSLSR